MSFLSGMFIGLQFPLAAKIYMSFHKEKKSLGQTVGLLYGADLFGGFFGGLLGGVLFLPVLGLKNTCFMMAMIKISSKKDTLLFLKTEALIVLYSILLPFVFFIPSQHIENKAIYFLLYSTFLLMSFLSGMFIGLQFPLAAKIYMSFHKDEKSLGQTAGLLYGADLFGGFFGGLLGGILFLPVLGLKNTCFMMAMIKISSGLLFLLFIKIQRAK